MQLTPEQEKKIKRVAKLVDFETKGAVVLLEDIFALEDKIPELKELIEELRKKSPDRDEVNKLISDIKIPKAIKGDKGDDYILTKEDKREIASMIDMPVVDRIVETIREKTEVIREQPIEIIKEVAIIDKTDLTKEGEAIRDGLELLQDEERLDKKAIKGLDDYEEISFLARQPKNAGGKQLFSQMNDVNMQGVTNGQVPVYNSATGLYEAGTASTDLTPYWKTDGSSGPASGNWNLGAYNLTTTGIISSAYSRITSLNSSTVGQIIKGFTGQTANLQEFRNSINQTQSYFDSNGILNCSPINSIPTVDNSVNYSLNSNPFVSGLTSWTSTGWTYSAVNGGSALHVTGNTNRLSQTVTAPLGTYEISYTLGTGTSGTFRLFVNGTQISSSSTAGVKTLYISNSTGSMLIEFEPSSTQTRPIYGLTIRAVLKSDPLFYGKQSVSTSFEARGDLNGNIGVGINALRKNITGNFNIGIGFNALSENVTGSYNLAIGYGVMEVSNGSFNTGIGYLAMSKIITGVQNFALGYQSLQALTTGSYNTVTGVLAGSSLLTGSYNNLYGNNAGRGLTTGSRNFLFGSNSGLNISTGSDNTIVGADSGGSSQDSSKCIAIGSTSSFFENITENDRLVIGTFMYGRYASELKTASLGYGTNATSTSRNRTKMVNNQITGTCVVSDVDGITVTGTGTLFTTELSVGEEIIVYPSNTFVEVLVTIASITSNTSLTLSTSVGTGFGSNYTAVIYKKGNIYSGLNYLNVEVFKVDSEGKTTTNGIKSTAGVLLPYTAKTATYTTTLGDYTVNCTANTFTVNLITAVGNTGQIFVIKNTGVGTITVDANASETIDGALTVTLSTNQSVTIQSTGSNWIVI